MTSRTVIVCGGAGYVGSHVLRPLAATGWTPVVVDDLSAGHAEALPEGAALVRASVGDQDAMRAIFAEHRPMAVMHFCASAYVGESVVNPRKYYRNNVVNGLALLEAMLDAGVSRIVFSSSCAVYGHPSRLPLDEDCPLSPISPYGRTKAMFERIMDDFGSAHGLHWAALRYFNAAGAAADGSMGEDHRPETHLIPLVLRGALRAPGERAQAVTVFGSDYDTPDGTCVRDYIHVTDLADAHVRALEYLCDGGASVALNLANERGYSVLEIIKACERATGRAIEFSVGPRRPGDPAALIGSFAAAKRTLGWQPRQSDLENILATAWKWHSTHPSGYGSARSS